MSEPDNPAAPDDLPTAQQSTVPGPDEQPTVRADREAGGSASTTPAVHEPATPAVQEPATPAVQEPATPAVQEPATPAVHEPATSAVQEPTTSAVEQTAVAAAPTPLGPTEVEPDTVGLLAERPEIAVGAAFAGGFLLALILKRLGR